jgi:catechol 2,3-dioxygenase-like lactoylglutathione lyase family enzyme
VDFRGAALAGTVIYVKDVSRAVDFYSAVLGVDVVERGDRFAVLSLGSAELNLVAMPTDVVESIVLTEPPAIREETAVKPSFLVPSLAGAAAAAHARGGGADPLARAWAFRGHRHLDGFDPEGNVIQFVERLDS